MNKYETIFIIDPKVEEAGIKELVRKFSDLINSDGKVEKVDEKGKLKLAYEIKKNKEGYYVVINFEANPNLISELERVYRITDSVLKFMTIRVEEKEEKEEVKTETKTRSRAKAEPKAEPKAEAEAEEKTEVEPEAESETESK